MAAEPMRSPGGTGMEAVISGAKSAAALESGATPTTAGVPDGKREPLLGDSPAARSHDDDDFKKMFVPVLVPQVAAYSMNMMLLPILPAYVMGHFGKSAATAGMCVSMLALAPVLLDMPGSILADRLGYNFLGLLAAASLLACGLLGLASDVCDSFALLVVSRIFNGFGQQMWQMSRMLLLASAPPVVRAYALSSVGMMGKLGSMIGPALGSKLFATFTISGVFVGQIFCGAFVLLLALWPILLPTSSWLPGFVTRAPDKKTGKTNLSGMMRCVVKCRRELQTTGVALMLLNFMRQTKDFLIVLKVNQTGGGTSVAGLAVTLSYTFDVMFSPVSGLLMGRRGRKYSLCSSLFVIGFACALLSTPPAGDSTYFLLFIACLAGAGNGLSSGLAMCIGSDLSVKAEAEGRCISKPEFIGPWRTLMDSGMLIGPLVAGGMVTACSLNISAFVCGALSVGGSLFSVRFVEETLQLGS